jgi:nuclear pore complex protein Nup107
MDEAPEDHEDILHPLREAADRVGREVEEFAKTLDGYNPLKATTDDERTELAFALLDSYHEIAVQTVIELRQTHGEERQRQIEARARKYIRGLESSKGPNEADMDMGGGLDENDRGGP